MLRRSMVLRAAIGLIAPSVSQAQSARKIYRIGILALGASADATGAQPRLPATRALLRGLQDLGYVYGEHFVTEARGADGKPERFPDLAAELIGQKVDVIVAAGPAMPVLARATTTIPIVMAAASDPVGLGYVQSLRRPGGNITGLSFQSIETVGKQLELLMQLIPPTGLVAVLWDRGSILNLVAAESAAQARGWRLERLEVRQVGDIESLIRAAKDARASALLVFAAGHLIPNGRRIAELAAKARLPAMYEQRSYVEAGGLVSYGADVVHLWRRAAGYVDRILKGAAPGDLAIEQPTKFELVINLKAAKLIGLKFPQSLLLRADEVIE